jgi:hypothetical protein
MEMPKNKKIELPHDLPIPFLGIYHIYSTNESKKKMSYVYTMEYYSAITNEIVLFTGKWMEMEINM